jgi:hypothetical protein
VYTASVKCTADLPLSARMNACLINALARGN